MSHFIAIEQVAYTSGVRDPASRFILVSLAVRPHGQEVAFTLSLSVVGHVHAATIAGVRRKMPSEVATVLGD